MFCPRCGKHVEMEGTRFCTECGYDLQPMKTELSNRLDVKHEDDTSVETPQERILIGNSYTTKSSMKTWEIRNDAPRYITPVSNIPKKKKNSSRGKVTAVVVALLMVFAGVAFVATAEHSTSSTNSTSDSGSSTVVTGESIDSYDVSYTGAFTSGVLSYTTGTHEFSGEEEDCIIITLSDTIASEYGYFVWTVYDNNGTAYIAYVYSSGSLVEYMYYSSSTCLVSEYVGTTVEKSEAVLYWSGYIAGDYTISVTCYASESAYESQSRFSSGGTEYSGDLVLDGDITTEYTWTYDGNSYDFTVTYTLSEFEEYHDADVSRSSDDGSTVTDFVVINDTISSIASELEELYLANYGSDASLSGQTFANFILAFVQYCYEYPAIYGNYDADMIEYGASEYYAYPMETIYYGMGDCEDTSILAASIYESCGYQVAIGLIAYGDSGHAVVGVALDSYETPTYNSQSFGILSQTIDGVTYYGGETTSSSYYALGVITKEYISSVGSYYGDILCGFYPV